MFQSIPPGFFPLEITTPPPIMCPEKKDKKKKNCKSEAKAKSEETRDCYLFAAASTKRPQEEKKIAALS